MKTIIILTMSVLSVLLYSQTNIVPGRGSPNPDEYPKDTYFKDTENELNIFEGEWACTLKNGNRIVFVLQKRKEYYDFPANSYYEDELRGSFRLYAPNGALIKDLTQMTQYAGVIAGIYSCDNEGCGAMGGYSEPDNPWADGQVTLTINKNTPNKLFMDILGKELGLGPNYSLPQDIPWAVETDPFLELDRL